MNLGNDAGLEGLDLPGLDLDMPEDDIELGMGNPFLDEFANGLDTLLNELDAECTRVINEG